MNELIINMGSNNRDFLSLTDDLLEIMTTEETIKEKPILQHKNCPLGLTEDFKHLPLIISNFITDQKEEFKEVKMSIQKISDTILDTDKGMIIRVKALESTKNSLLKWFWIVSGSGTTFLLTKYVISLFS